MALTALLTLDLDKQATAKQRVEFYQALKNEGWDKLPNLTTTWATTFEDGTSRDDAIQMTEDDVANAAADSNVNIYDAAVQVGEGDISVF